MSTTSIEPPIWLESTLSEIRELIQLGENWDSYGAKRIDPRCAETAANLLKAVLDTTTPRPSVVPTNRGGVQLEWHRGGIDLEVEIESPAQINVSFEDELQEVSSEMTLSGNIRPLVEFLRRLESAPTDKWHARLETLIASMPNGNPDADFSRSSIYNDRGE